MSGRGGGERQTYAMLILTLLFIYASIINALYLSFKKG